MEKGIPSGKAESQVTLASRHGPEIIRNPPWWHRRTRMERNLTLLIGVCLLVAVGLAVALAAILTSRQVAGRAMTETLPSLAEALKGGSSRGGRKYEENLPTDINDLCLTDGCVQTSADIMRSVDKSKDPCDNFYEFACGGFVKTTTIPDDKTQMTTFGILSDKLDEQLRILVEQPVKDDEPVSFRLVKNLYKSCMNKTLIEQLGLDPLKNIVKELGGWPVVEGDQWDPSRFDWRQSVYKFRRMGYSVDYFLDFSVTTDVKNSTRRIIDIDQPSLGLSREYILRGPEDKDVKSYLNYQVRLAQLLGADVDRARKELREVLDFEIKLANFSLPREERRNASKLYNPMTIEELGRRYPSIPWMEYINNLLPEGMKVGIDETVIVDVPPYVRSFEKLISETDKRIQGNYVLWRAVAASVSYTTEEARRIQLDYSSALTGRAAREPRWKECVGVVSGRYSGTQSSLTDVLAKFREGDESEYGSLANAVGALYVRNHFREDARQNAQDMVRDIRAEFLQMLDELDWMAGPTKSRARDKAQSMDTHIGYPIELLDDNKLNELYKGLEMSPDTYLENILNLTTFGTDYAFSKLRERVNKTDWVSHGRPAIVNAFYSPLENSIQFPAGILQGVFFSNDRPRYMNYGAIGWVIGHEITHGFDDQGRQFDKEGNLVDWWEKATMKQYLDKAQCIIWQYGNYTAPSVGLNLNGINTQGENIADNGGVKEAYRAYQKWVKQNGKEKQLPGLPYSQNQLFWISAANVWCNTYRPETLKLRILTGVHSPGEFRVIGPFSNMPEFAKDFRCPAGSRMNPNNKCRVW